MILKTLIHYIVQTQVLCDLIVNKNIVLKTTQYLNEYLLRHTIYNKEILHNTEIRRNRKYRFSNNHNVIQ